MVRYAFHVVAFLEEDHMGYPRLALLSTVLIVSGLGLVANAEEEPAFVGIAAGYTTRTQKPFGVIELLAPIAPHVHANLSLDYQRVARVRHFVTSLDVQYRARIRGKLVGWVGLGLGVRSDDPVGPGESTTRDVQADALLGLGRQGPLMPYVQFKVAGGKPSFTVGLRLGL